MSNPEHIRILEAVLFAAEEPLDVKSLADRLPADSDIDVLLSELTEKYAKSGFHLVRIGQKYAFRTAPDLAHALQRHVVKQKRMSKAGLETLAIIAYHQPVTRAEIEEIRGVSVSKGTVDVLLESEWIKIRGRRRAPGRPVTYGTTEAFLAHFDLETIQDLPGLAELKASGLLDDRLPPDFEIPDPDPENDAQEIPLADDDDGHIEILDAEAV